MLPLFLLLLAGTSQAQHVPATSKHVLAQGKCKPPFACINAAPGPTSKPGLGEVLVRLSSSSVNPSVSTRTTAIRRCV
jgi:hypothetical protein